MPRASVRATTVTVADRPKPDMQAALEAEMVGHVPCCDFGTLADLPNASTMFAEFEHVDSN